MKFGASWFHLMFRPADPDSARGSFAFTNRWTSSQVGGTDGNAFADFLLGYPTSCGHRTRRRRFAHQLDSRLYPGRLGSSERPDDQRWTPLRIQPTHAGGGQSIVRVDLTVPGGRYVIATNKDGTRSSASSGLLPLLPLMPGDLTTSARRCNAARTRKLPVVRPANR